MSVVPLLKEVQCHEDPVVCAGRAEGIFSFGTRGRRLVEFLALSLYGRSRTMYQMCKKLGGTRVRSERGGETLK